MVLGLSVLLYTYTVYCFYYLSNHVNHLFIMYQKIIQMAISFKINIDVYVFASSLIYCACASLLGEAFCLIRFGPALL